MAEITEKLFDLLQQNVGAPFLFIGSGFSRRYIGLEQWDELLARFCQPIKEFGYYASNSNNELPKAATEMASDFNDAWWTLPDFEESRSKYKASVRSKSSALKIEISTYLVEKAHQKVKDSDIAKEIDALSRLNVDGIITTNWDLFLEELFPDYKIFIGQEELLFSNPQSIAEIYKIHGCASQPESLVLTQEDYDLFNAKNPYLAAKLITIFIEHPIIFIGYSLSDPNIRKIISSIVGCLGSDKLEIFGRNLIFLQRTKAGENPSFQPAIINIGETNLNITVVKTNNYLDVYDAIEKSKRKIPARILRYCKEQMYDLVKSSKPEAKMAVVDIDQIEDKDDIEFVVGVGVADVQNKISSKGYSAIALEDIFGDLLKEDSDYDAHQLLNGVYPTLFKRPNKYVPAFKYLRRCGINTFDELRGSKHSGIEDILKKSSGAKNVLAQYQRQYDNYYKGKSLKEIIEIAPPEKVPMLVPFLKPEDIDVATLGEFLSNHKDKFSSEVSNYSSYFRKLACLYDQLKYGF